MLEIVYLSGQSAALIGRRTAAFELREGLERLDARLVEIEFALRFLNFGCDRRALARRRLRQPRLQILDARADRVAGGVERPVSLRDVAQPGAARAGGDRR